MRLFLLLTASYLSISWFGMCGLLFGPVGFAHAGQANVLAFAAPRFSLDELRMSQQSSSLRRHFPIDVDVSSGFGVHRQALTTNALIPAIPVLIVDLVPFLGNVIALSSGLGRVGWGVSGIAFGGIGTLLMLPLLSLPTMAIALGLLQALLFGLSLANLVLGLQKQQRERDAAKKNNHDSFRREGASLNSFGSFRMGRLLVSQHGWQITGSF